MLFTPYLLVLLPMSVVPAAVTPKEKVENVNQINTHSMETQTKVAASGKTTIDQNEEKKQQSQDKNQDQQIIRITNNIESSMLQYKHWTGTYEPTAFALTINGKKIEPGTAQEIPVYDRMLEIRYDYSFMHGIRQGAKIVEFQVEKNRNDLQLTFSWDNEWRVIIDHASPLNKKQA